MINPAGPIIVVDDDPKIVRLVRTYLEREGFRVVEATNGKSALAVIALEAPSLVVLDLMLPELDGLAVIRAVRRTQRTPIVVLSARGTAADRIAGLADGADDYVPKPFSPAELVLRVRRVLERTEGGRSDGPAQPVPIEPLRLGDLVVDRERHEVSVGSRNVELTAVEFRLLVALVSSGGRVLSRDQLLDAVQVDGEVDVLDRTIDAHVRRLRVKLGDDAREPRYVATVRGVGYRAAPDVPNRAAPDVPNRAAPDVPNRAAPDVPNAGIR